MILLAKDLTSYIMYSCSTDVNLVHFILQAMKFVVDKINARSNLNKTLGYIILDDCSKQNVASAHALSFVHVPRCGGTIRFCLSCTLVDLCPIVLISMLILIATQQSFR